MNLTNIDPENTATTEKRKKVKIALVGNPNSGKSTLFNVLTGLKQNTANFPGITVDKKIGTCTLNHLQGKNHTFAEIIDLPGTYSLYPKSIEEQIAVGIISNPAHKYHPDIIICIADASNLKRNLLLCTQLIDLKVPVVLALNMIDMAEAKNITIHISKLSEQLGVEVIPINARKKRGIEKLKMAALTSNLKNVENNILIDKTAHHENTLNPNTVLSPGNVRKTPFEQTQETLNRYKKISEILNECLKQDNSVRDKTFTNKLDNILTHRILGYAIFLSILFLIFQAIFNFAAYPMTLIESAFLNTSVWLLEVLPHGMLTDLFVNGIVAGLSGIVMFVPQIALLFTFIAILEDTGYMARVSFIMDKLMRKFGLNGKSVIPLISGVACAVPAIMSARTISNWKERMITIMVTPLMTCSARLPVYILLISMVVPNETVFGVFNIQGVVLMALYLIGFIAAIGSAWAMKFILKAKERSYFIMEMPVYRMPRWSSIGITIFDKIKIFLFDVGKVIIAISIILWVLSSYSPGNAFEKIEEKYQSEAYISSLEPEEISSKIQSEKLASSYIGILGKTIEPVIAPLGFDWKIGIALITSFAAREIFVGTMSTIYNVGDQKGNKVTIREKMMAEINPKTGEPLYTVAVGFALMIFYAFAMQCMSTVAVVFRETGHWKWPVLQILYMSGLAYLASLVVYQLFK
ncbi:MAG: ferrous iron transport protein B [Bacteroidia bacterium]|nr:ferrous iron transport protein B [Bacteroidia bacterium]